MTARAYLGAGDVLINPVDPATGLNTGWVYAGDASKFSLKPNSELKEAESKGRDTTGQVIASAARTKPAEIAITFREANKRVLALAFSGEESVINQSSGSVTDQVVNLRKGGGGAKLLHGNLAQAGFVLTSSPAGTTYALNTDFTVNWRLGIVYPVAGSALATAINADSDGVLPLLVDYTYNAITGTRIRGATRPQLKTAVMLDGKNLADESPMIANVWEAVLTPTSEFDFLADDWAEVELTGRMNTPTGKTEPFEVELRDL